MILLRNKAFSKLEDEDYINREEDRKRSVKHAKGAGTAVGAVGGGLVGAHIGSVAGKKGAGIGAAAGAVIGGTVGRFAGKKIKESTEKDADKKITRYKKASEKDKKYLREKEERDLDRRIQERQARAQERIAWNTL